MPKLHVTLDLGPLKNALMTERDMRDVGDYLISRIRTRTERGVDVSGAPFAAYSDSYAARKEAALGHARVDLTVSGRMLNDMKVTAASASHLVITFVSQGGRAGGGTFIQRSRAVGALDKATWNNPRREFFAVSEEDERTVVDMLDRVLQRRLATL